MADSDEAESEAERLDRNWNEILQELRVTQTGTQILTGFLLTLAFQPRTADLDPIQLGIYLSLVVVAALATGLGLVPVSMHRALFRRRARPQLVSVANVVLRVTLGAVALLLSGTTLLIFDVLVGRSAGVMAGGAIFLVSGALWWVLPVISDRMRRTDDSAR